MPSGPKKRKADKKKKEKEANLQSPTNSQGTDDLKSHDEKESDGGELSSPASQDHHDHDDHDHDHHFEGDQEKRDSSLDNQLEGSANGKGRVVRELKSDDDSESQNVSIEYFESVKKSLDGGSSGDAGSSSSSSSSSSDDESLPVEKLEEDEVCNSGSVEPVVCLSEEVTQVELETLVENTGASEVIELGLKEKEEKILPLSDVNAVAPVVTALAFSDEIPGSSSGVMKENGDKLLGSSSGVMKENGDKLLGSSDAWSVETSNGGEHSIGHELPESSETQPLIASTPRPVQSTSWKGCCGIFDVLTGSNS